MHFTSADQKWNHVTLEPTVLISNLKQGSYILGANISGSGFLTVAEIDAVLAEHFCDTACGSHPGDPA
jgi:hypothetical protein